MQKMNDLRHKVRFGSALGAVLLAAAIFTAAPAQATTPEPDATAIGDQSDVQLIESGVASPDQLASMQWFDISTGEPMNNPYASSAIGTTKRVGVPSPQSTSYSTCSDNTKYRVYYHMYLDSTPHVACFDQTFYGGSLKVLIDSTYLISICPGNHKGQIKVRTNYNELYWTPVHDLTGDLNKCYSWSEQGVPSPQTFVEVFLLSY